MQEGTFMKNEITITILVLNSSIWRNELFGIKSLASDIQHSVVHPSQLTTFPNQIQDLFCVDNNNKTATWEADFHYAAL